MKKSLILLILSVFIIVSDCIPQSPDDYFDRVAVVSDGRLTRFANIPITVYVEGLSIQGNRYADDIGYALKEWEDCSSGMVKFKLVESPEGSDILVSWVVKLESSDQEHPLGIAELQRIDRDKFNVEMRICTRDSRNTQPLTNEQMKVVLLHEFGHAIGLWGHSKDKADVMYYATEALHPTPRDISTIKLVYSNEPNFSLHAQSISAIREEISLHPEDANQYFLLGMVYMDQGIYSVAIEDFKKCLNLDSRFHKAGIALATAYHSIGQDQSALAEYLTLVKSAPSAMLYNIIGVLYFENGDAEKAIQNFKKALEIERIYDPARRNLYKVYLNKGKELINNRMYNEAIEFLLEGLKLFPDKPEFYNTLGTAYSGNEQFQEAVNCYNKAIQINPAYTPAKESMASCYNNQGIKYAEAGMWDDAIKAYNQALTLNPGMESAQKNLLALYWNWSIEMLKAGKDKEAAAILQQIIAREPYNKDVHNNLGATYFRLGRYEDAIAEFEKALSLAPGSKDARDNILAVYQKWGIILMEGRSYNQAVEKFKKALARAPDDANIHISLAIAYQRMGKLDDSIQHINTVLSLNPESTDAKKLMTAIYIEQGNKYLTSKDYDRALESYLKVPVKLMPHSMHDNIGYIYIMKKMYMEAANEFDEALKADPEDKVANQNLISIETTLSHSLSHDRNSQKIKDELARARLSIAIAHANRGDMYKAKSVLRTAIDLSPARYELRQMMIDGCKKMAEMFAKKGMTKDSDEIKDWIAQLR